MNEEEKKAIEKFSNLMTKHFEDKKIDTSDYLDYFEGITILNLIDKQQKEIEELKKNKGYHLGFIDGGIAKRYEMQDKIKEKIKELEKEYKKYDKEELINLMKITSGKISSLEELLGE